MAVCIALPLAALAQPAAPAKSATTPASGAKASPLAAVKASTSRPAWVELTPMQQQALKPLAGNWDTNISEPQKRKWLEVSKNYPSLPPEDQAVLHSRMNEWIALSPEQRAQARLNFAKTKELSKQLTPEEKKAKWQTYQALSPEEKQKLAAKASPKPAGAATAIKPVAPQKLAVVPAGSVKPPAKAASRISPSVPPAASATVATPPAATP